MPSLQDILSRSLVQSLGLQDILAQRQREAEQLGRVEALKGEVEAANIQSDIFRKAGKKRGLFETIGTVLGATGGFVFGGGLQGASLGAKLGGSVGGAVSGVSPQVPTSGLGQALQTGLSAVADIESFGKQQEALKRKEKFEKELKLAEFGLKKEELDLKKFDRISEDIVNTQGFSKPEVEEVRKLRENITKDPTFKSAQGQLFDVNKASELLEVGNPISDAAAQAAVARLFEKGVLTDADINRLGGSRDISTFLSQYAKRAKDGTLLPENRQFMRQIVNTMERSASQTVNTILGRELSSFENLTGIGQERTRKVFDPYLQTVPEKISATPQKQQQIQTGRTQLMGFDPSTGERTFNGIKESELTEEERVALKNRGLL